MSNRFERILKKFSNKEYRSEYVSVEITNKIAMQVKHMRISSGMTQAELAKELGTRQSVISRLENPIKSKVSLSTLKEIAKVFDVALQVKFTSFVDFAKDLADESSESLDVKSFEDSFSSYNEAVWQKHSNSLSNSGYSSPADETTWHSRHCYHSSSQKPKSNKSGIHIDDTRLKPLPSNITYLANVA